MRAPRRVLSLLIALVVMTGVVPLAGDTALADPLVEGGWTTTARSSLAVVAPRQTVTIELDVTAPSRERVVVDAEVYDSAGRQVLQRSWSSSFRAGRARTYTTSWTIPDEQPAGVHTVTIGIFTRGRARLLHWNDRASSFRISSSSPPATTTTTTVATSSPSTTLPPATTLPTTTTTIAPPPTSAPPTTSPPPTTSAPPTTSPPQPPPPPSGVQFFEDFSTAGSVNRFEWRVHVGGAANGARLGSSAADGNPNVAWVGEHNTACAGPDTLRDVRGGQTTGDPFGDTVWWCAPGGDASRGHVMTAIDTASVAVLSFSPPQAFSNVSRVCWDQNANNLGGGKWANMHIVPASNVAANGGRLDYTGQPVFDVDQIVPPADAITVVGFTGNISAYLGQTQLLNEGSPNPGFLADTPAPRFQTCVQDLRNGTIRFSIARPSGVTQTFDRAGSFPAGPVRVIWQDWAYNPAKHAGTGHLTWHWDNIQIS